MLSELVTSWQRVKTPIKSAAVVLLPLINVILTMNRQIFLVIITCIAIAMSESIILALFD